MVEKATYKDIIRERFYDLEKFLQDQVKVRNQNREDRAALQKKAASGDYSQEYIEREQAKLGIALQSAGFDTHQKALELMGKLLDTAQARYDEPLNLDDPALGAALNIINLAGSSLDQVELSKMVKQFTSNPPALKTLRSIFEKQGNDAGVKLVNDQLYDPGLVLASWADWANQTFLNNGSITALASEINRTAQKEGLSFPREGDIDPQAFEEAVRAGMGLSAE